jgi:hypothetical protein
MRLVWTIMMGAALSGGCAAPPDTRTPEDAAAAPARALGRQATRPLLREHSSGQDEAVRRVISDVADFAAAWDRAYARSGHTPAVPMVDFGQEVVVMAAFGTRRSGGYAIDIDSVRVATDAYEVFVRTTSPGPTCGATAALTQPVVMVAAPRPALPVRFHEHASVTNCG